MDIERSESEHECGKPCIDLFSNLSVNFHVGNGRNVNMEVSYVESVTYGDLLFLRTHAYPQGRMFGETFLRKN